MATLPVLGLDPTGQDSNNLIELEDHLLVNKRYRAIAPLYGVFFTDSVSVYDRGNANKQLTQGTDYVFIELHRALTLKYQKDVAGIILITNKDVSREVSVSYQALGDIYGRRQLSLQEFLNKKPDSQYDTPKWELRNEPKSIVPDVDTHHVGYGFGFEYVVYALERLRQQIVWGESSQLDGIMAYIDEFLNGVEVMIDRRATVDLANEIAELRKRFTKGAAGLSNIINYRTATEEEGKLYASENWQYSNDADNRYIASSALMGFKSVLYTNFVLSSTTKLGKYQGEIAVPTMATLKRMVNGEVVLWDSIDTNALYKVPYDNEAYPEAIYGKCCSTSQWVIKKLTNNPNDMGGTFLGISTETGELYTGSLTIEDQNQSSMRWDKVLTDYDLNLYLSKLTEHMADEDNPHQTDKRDVGLGNVENLPTVTRDDIVCRVPLRKYVTFDAAILFMRIHLEGLLENEDGLLPERFRLIFAPCGPCGVQPYEVEEPDLIKDDAIRPRDILLGKLCSKYDRIGVYTDGLGGSYERLIENNSEECNFVNPKCWEPRGTPIETYCEGLSLYRKFSNGTGGYYTELVMETSPECEASVPATTTFVEIYDTQDKLVGYGVDPQGSILDPDCNVLLDDINGVAFAYIFSVDKVTVDGYNATTPVRTEDGKTLGFAIVSTTRT